jgi:hypothetical protein
MIVSRISLKSHVGRRASIERIYFGIGILSKLLWFKDHLKRLTNAFPVSVKECSGKIMAHLVKLRFSLYPQ